MIFCQGIKAKFLSERESLRKRLRNDVCKSTTVSMWFSVFCCLGAMSLAVRSVPNSSTQHGISALLTCLFQQVAMSEEAIDPGCWFPCEAECQTWVVACSAPWRLLSMFTLSRNPGALLKVTGQQNMLTLCLTNGPGWKQPGDRLWQSV